MRKRTEDSFKLKNLDDADELPTFAQKRKKMYETVAQSAIRNPRLGGSGACSLALSKRNPAYLEGTYIHRSNWNGFAGSYNKKSKDGYWTTHGVSEGCLLVEPKKWNEFYSQLKEMSEFKLILRR